MASSSLGLVPEGPSFYPAATGALGESVQWEGRAGDGWSTGRPQGQAWRRGQGTAGLPEGRRGDGLGVWRWRRSPGTRVWAQACSGAAVRTGALWAAPQALLASQASSAPPQPQFPCQHRPARRCPEGLVATCSQAAWLPGGAGVVGGPQPRPTVGGDVGGRGDTGWNGDGGADGGLTGPRAHTEAQRWPGRLGHGPAEAPAGHRALAEAGLGPDAVLPGPHTPERASRQPAPHRRPDAHHTPSLPWAPPHPRRCAHSPSDTERGPRAPGATRPGRPLLWCGFARPSWGATALTWASGPLCPAQGQTVAGGPTTSPDVGATGPPGGSGLWAGPWSLPFQCLLLLGQGQAALYPVTQPGVWACVACPGPGARPVALARGPDHSPLPAPAAGPDTLPASVRGYSRSWWPPSGP